MRRFIPWFLLLAIGSMAANLTGTWSGRFTPEGGEHNIPQILVLKQQGQTLSGSAGPNAGEQYPIENGRVDGNKATFQVTTGEWKFTYNLTGGGESLKGDLKLESPTESRSAKVTLNRTKN